MLHIKKNLYNKILRHARDTYPYEGCGVMLGSEDGVLKVMVVENRNRERANDRYEIEPEDIFRIEKEATKEGLEIIGFYHTHPDHPAEPSEYDRERAWPVYRYMIISVNNGTVVSTRVWSFPDFNGGFKEEELKVEG